MRIALAFAALALGGCLIEDSGDPDYYGSGGNWGSGWGGGGGQYELGCQSDSECGTGRLCTRTGECLVASEVRAVRTNWTIRGKTPSDATCSAAPRLSITFTSNLGEEFGYTPVPCDAGRHTIDKFPVRYTSVQLAREEDYGGGDFGTFDATGTALLDLPY